ncbi:unnamed protein product [Lactuca saligna]|uniref:Carboxypeptidase n=1 Tax=Lactuca saligna TaxID=75948 RepID=A0AA35ZAK0_LACSI|nr:unnamed protein product [Lactuca saligna]
MLKSFKFIRVWEVVKRNIRWRELATYEETANPAKEAEHLHIRAHNKSHWMVIGDHDLRVPYTGTEAWTRSLGYKVIDEWRSWKVDDQIAGYTQGYDKNLTFLTVKGAGHRVPEYKPKEALVFTPVG